MVTFDDLARSAEEAALQDLRALLAKKNRHRGRGGSAVVNAWRRVFALHGHLSARQIAEVVGCASSTVDKARWRVERLMEVA